MLEKLFDMKPIRWNSLSSCCCDRMAPVAKLDALHSRWKGLDLEGKASMGVEVMALFSASKWGWASEACPWDCLCKLDWSQSSLWKYSFITHHKCLIRQKVELKVT